MQPIQPRHLQIEQHKIRVEDGQARQRIDAIDGTVDLVPFRFDPVGQGLADILVIIDDEQISGKGLETLQPFHTVLGLGYLPLACTGG